MRISLLILLCSLSSVGVSFGQDSTNAKQPAPSAAEIKAAQTSLNDLYKLDFAKLKKSKSQEDKKAFADRLLKQALDSADDPASQFACMAEARKLYEGIGDVAGATVCIDTLAVRFAIDALTLKIESLSATSGRSPADIKAISDQALWLLDIAHAEEKFEKAGQLLQVAQSAAGKLKDKRAVKQVADLKQNSAELRREFDGFQKAMEVLEKTPDDLPANLAAGKYLCLIRGDWKEGAPRLLKGSDQQLKAIAQREIAVPADGKQVVELADAWWDLAQQERGSYKTRYQREAEYWYRIGAVEATGLTKATIDKRLEQAAGFSPRITHLQPGLVEVIYEGLELEKQLVARIDRKIDNDFGYGPAVPGTPNERFSVLWTGYVKVPATGVYMLFFEHDDGARLWIDDKPIVEGPNLNGSETKEVQLAAGLHRIKVTMFELGGPGFVHLNWSRADTERSVIPDSAFFYDPNFARAIGVK